ncbi:putative adenylyltransferase/sulfurtransferase MoeZ [Planctomycetes bacterium Pla163]|uniref:Putative adenylyltransferase/sulfurtransferase MoeZ n=1 Tax=Rohdeia mirabilis TaxID=2528008 RepID=A0A518CZF3_9BACT|nr:putative adenylyltransferase/sulfurtransferase MoeZ [Planctomycetes bacterium Pla163]
MVVEITPAQLQERIASGDRPVLLDVRRPEELAICRIDGVVHIPLDELASRAHELDPEVEIVCICHHGMRSASAAAFLESRDFGRMVNLTGGMEAWASQVDPSMARY